MRTRTRARARPVLQRDEDRVAARERRRPARARRSDGRAVFGTIDAWLVFKLTGEHRTDVTNASRTMLYDIGRGDWDDELLALFGDVPRAALPEVLPSIGEFGTRARRRARRRPRRRAGRAASPATSRPRSTARAASTPGLGKNTYGTGSFVLLNSGEERADRAARPARDGRVGDRRAHDLRARGGDLRHRRGRAVAARRPRHHRAGRPRPRSSPRRWTPTTASTSSRR